MQSAMHRRERQKAVLNSQVRRPDFGDQGEVFSFKLFSDYKERIFLFRTILFNRSDAIAEKVPSNNDYFCERETREWNSP